MKTNSFTTFVLMTSVSLTSLFSYADTLQKELMQCAKVDENSARLACFDRLTHTSTLATSKAKVKPVVATTLTNDESFGAEHLKKFNASKENVQVTFTVEKLKKDHYKKWYFTFKNGQQWKQTDTSYFKIKVGDSVILKKGAFGSFHLKKNMPNSNRSIRVKRIK